MARLLGLTITVVVMGVMVFTGGDAWAEANNPFQKAFEDRFKAMDANNDGKIDYSEYKAGYQKSIQASFERRDRNGDGELTKDEFMFKTRRPAAKGSDSPFQRTIQKRKPGQQEDKAPDEK